MPCTLLTDEFDELISYQSRRVSAQSSRECRSRHEVPWNMYYKPLERTVRVLGWEMSENVVPIAGCIRECVATSPRSDLNRAVERESIQGSKWVHNPVCDCLSE